MVKHEASPGRRYDAVIFDFDGTLVDSIAVYEQVITQCCEHFDLPLPDPEKRELWRGMETRQMLRSLGLRWWQVPRFVAYARRQMLPLANEVRLFAGMSTALQHLHDDGVQLILVTSNSEDVVDRILDPSLKALFSQCHCSVPLLGKQRVLLRAVQAAGVPRQRVLSIGDERRDGQASEKAGVDFVGVAWGLASVEALQPLSRWPVLTLPTMVLHTVYERGFSHST